MASRSSCPEGDVDKLGWRFPMFEPLGDHAQGKSLDAGNGFIAIGTVAHHAGEVGHFSQPAPIYFALKFDRENHIGNLRWHPLFNKARRGRTSEKTLDSTNTNR